MILGILKKFKGVEYERLGKPSMPSLLWDFDDLLHRDELDYLLLQALGRGSICGSGWIYSKIYKGFGRFRIYRGLGRFGIYRVLGV